MRSLIVLEVEHGEDTDSLSDLTGWLENQSFSNWSGLTVKDWCVRVDVPAAMVIELDIPTTARLHKMNASTFPKE